MSDQTPIDAGSERARRQALVAALTSRVRSGLHLGILRRGDRLPSARDVARELGGDPRLALAAYRVLAERGLVELRARSGVFVATDAEAAPERVPGRASWLVDVLAEGIGAGVPAPEFAERVRRSLETLRLRALVLECNADQLFSVADELRRDYGLETVTADVADLDAARDDRALTDALPRDARRVQCVATTSPHGALAHRVAAVLGVPPLVLSMCDDLFREVGRLLGDRPVYFVVSDRRFATKLGSFFAKHPDVSRLRILVLGDDDLATIPTDAPTYFTRLTRRNAGELPILERLIAEARVFDPASVRAVLDFVVSENFAVLGG